MTSSSMPSDLPSFAVLQRAARQAGLEPRGAFRTNGDESAPANSVWILLLGAVGGSAWPAFASSPEAKDGRDHALDRWSERVIGVLARRFSAQPLFPFGGPPYRPFLRWARLAEGLSHSPLGMLIHPRHGLWHSYRGALAFPGIPADWREEPQEASPCETCQDRPCLSACPVGAFSPDGYDVAACREHLAGPSGSPCMTGGCLARRACPVAPDLAYAHDQTAFHMRAFLASGMAGTST